MLLLHEVHRVAGSQEEAFESAYRDRLIPALAETEGSRLLWFLRVAHGSGPAYTVVSIIGCRDAVAWAELAERIRHGDLAEWSSEVDAMRHTCEAKILTPVSWSPLQQIDLASVPTSGTSHELSLIMEDTAWPYPGGLRAYLGKAGTLYDTELSRSKQEGRGIIELEAAFQPLYGSHHTNEVVLLAACRQPQGAALPPRQRHAGGGERAGDLDARRTGRPRPLGEQDPAHRRLVTPLLRLDGPPP